MKKLRKGKTVPRRERSSERRLRPGLRVSPLILAERLGYESRREQSALSAKPGVSFLRRLKRLPVLGLRSQRERMESVKRRRGVEKFVGLDALRNYLMQRSGSVSVCRKREARRRVLFKMRIAGRGMRRSPGRGGTYRRTVDSSVTCRR